MQDSPAGHSTGEPATQAVVLSTPTKSASMPFTSGTFSRPEVVLCCLALLMIVQAAMVYYLHRGEKWRQSAIALTWHIRVAWAVLAVAVATALLYFLPKSPAAVTDAKAIQDLLGPSRGVLLFGVLAFFAVAVQFARQHVVEQLLDTPLGSSALSRWRRVVLDAFGGKDPWLAWLFFGVLATALEPFITQASGVSGSDQSAKAWFASRPEVFAGIMCVYAAAVYFLWTLSAIRRRLVNEDRFRGPIVAVFARSPISEVPAQAVLLGPLQSGKSHVFRRCMDHPQERDDGTTWMKMGQRAVEGVRLSAIDLPGENLGSHIAAVSRFRADLVVLVLRVGHLDGGGNAIDNPINFIDLKTFVEKCVTATNRLPTATREYLTSLRMATSFSPNDPSPFLVRRVLLLFNYANGDEAERLMANRLQAHDGISRLTNDVARYFQVDPSYCVGLVADASTADVINRIYSEAIKDT